MKSLLTIILIALTTLCYASKPKTGWFYVSNCKEFKNISIEIGAITYYGGCDIIKLTATNGKTIVIASQNHTQLLIGKIVSYANGKVDFTMPIYKN